MNNRHVCVLGAGGHAKVVIQTLQEAGYVVAALYDDAPNKWGNEIFGILVKGPIEEAYVQNHLSAVIGIGDNRVRQNIAESAPEMNWAVAIHPDAVMSKDVVVGLGAVVFAGSVIQPGAVIGRHVIVNTSATVDHDCRIGDFSHIAPGCHLAGNVVLEEGAMMGIGSVAVPGVRIGAWAKIGAGSVVTKDVPSGAVAVGVPARVMKLAQ